MIPDRTDDRRTDQPSGGGGWRLPDRMHPVPSHPLHETSSQSDHISITIPVAPKAPVFPTNGFQKAQSAAGEVDVEANQLAVPDKARPNGHWDKVNQDHMKQRVSAHAFATSLTSQLDPKVRPEFDQALRALVVEVRTHSSADGASQQLKTASKALESAVGKLDKEMLALSRSTQEFLRSEARAKTGNHSFADKARRNVFGKEFHAVLTRSALQAGLVTGSTTLLQIGITKAMESYFSGSNGRIPDDLLASIKKDMKQKNPSQQEIIRHAIKELSKPGSTYLDEATSTAEAIMGVEAAVGVVRGTVLPIADSKNEISGRAARVQKAVDNAREPKPDQSRWELAKASMKNSASDQIKYSAYSGALAAAVQLFAAKSAPGWKDGVEALKTMFFSELQAMGSIGADGARAAMKLDPDGQATQWAKFCLRVLSRAVSQGAKTAVSIGQSAGEGSLGNRSIPGDLQRAAIMGVGGGVIKEAFGTAAQIVSNGGLPPDEVAMLKVTSTINAAAKVLQAVDQLRDAGVNANLLTPVEERIAEAFEDITNANALDFNTDAFDDAFRQYAADVNTAIVEENLGRERPLGRP